MNKRPKPKAGGHYRIIAVENPSNSQFVGMRAQVITWDASGYRAPWGILTATLEDGSYVHNLACAIKRAPVLCECKAFPFPHKPGERCKK